MIWERWGYAAAATALLALTLGVAGCGSSEKAAEELPHLTKAQLLKKAEAICLQGNEAIKATFNPWEKKHLKDFEAGEPPTSAELDEIATKAALPVRKMELRRLRALGIPHPGAATYRRILAAMEEGIEEGEQDHSSMRKVGDEYAFAKAFELSFAYGLTSCWLE